MIVNDNKNNRNTPTLSDLIKKYKVQIETRNTLPNDTYFECYTSATIRLSRSQIDKYLKKRYNSKELSQLEKKLGIDVFFRKISSSEEFDGRLEIDTRFMYRIILKVVLSNETVMTIKNDDSINEEEKEKKISRTLVYLTSRELKTELKFLLLFLQEQELNVEDISR